MRSASGDVSAKKPAAGSRRLSSKVAVATPKTSWMISREEESAAGQTAVQPAAQAWRSGASSGGGEGRDDGRCGAADEASAWRGGGGEEDGKQHLNSCGQDVAVDDTSSDPALRVCAEEREPRPTMQRIWSPWTKRGAHAARYARLRLHGAWPISRLLRPLR